MAKIPVNIDPTSLKKRQVTAIFYVDGKEYIQETYVIDEFAIPQIVADAMTQLDDPDYDRAIETARDNNEPLPPGY